MQKLNKPKIYLSFVLSVLVIGVPLFGYMESEASSADITVLLINGAPQNIVYISDPHLRDENIQNVNKIIDDINSLNPSVLLIGGDFIFGDGSNFSLQKVWNSVKAPTYAVLGNHDYHSGITTSSLIAKTTAQTQVNLSKEGYNVSNLLDETSDMAFAENLTQRLTGNGVRVLKNEYVMEDINGSQLLIVGIDDGLAGMAKPPAIPDNGTFNLYLIHEPDLRSDWGADLVLAGHTHGGQFLPKNFNISGMILSGLISDKDQNTYVSRGIGTSNLNQEIRLFSTPEIVVINPTIPPEEIFPDKKVDYIDVPKR